MIVFRVPDSGRRAMAFPLLSFDFQPLPGESVEKGQRGFPWQEHSGG